MTRAEILQIAKPILFNTEMVRAILDGRKTETRRVIKFHPNKYTNEIPKPNEITVCGNTLYHEKVCFSIEPFYTMDIKKPYERFDYLYVREAWAKQQGLYWHKAGLKLDDNGRAYGCVPPEKWCPSIHMPKEAARILLRVTNMRAERLQEIEKDGLVKEGIDPFDNNFGELEYATAEFAALWDSTIKNKDRDKYGWDANPWVWVIEFEKAMPE